MYQRLGGAAYKADLSNTWKLAGHLGNPQDGFKSIHVAGTNGKGSCSHMLASIFQEAGYKVGLYTSPHLKDFRERIKINGEMIPKRSVSVFVTKHKSFFEENSLSFFEMTVGLAFDYFRKEKVDIAIIEVGLGGRLDSTNIITPELSIITNIGLDHTKFLGTTLSEIAEEKAGIIKPLVPVVIGQNIPETQKIFDRRVRGQGTSIRYAQLDAFPDYESDLKGNYQRFNQRTVVTAVEILNKMGWNISEAALKCGLSNVMSNTGLFGRWQVLKEMPKVICDTAHNMEGLMPVLQQLNAEKFKKLHIVLGVVNDKDLDRVLGLFSNAALYYFCKPDVPRGLDAQVLAKAAQEFNLMGTVWPSVKRAYSQALKNANSEDLVFVGGSTFVVAEVL